MTDAQWDVLFDVNVDGVWRLAVAAVPALLSAPVPRQGRFVAVSSAAGVLGLRRLAAYRASKHAVIGLVQRAGCRPGRHRGDRQRGLPRLDPHRHCWRSRPASTGWARARSSPASSWSNACSTRGARRPDRLALRGRVERRHRGGAGRRRGTQRFLTSGSCPGDVTPGGLGAAGRGRGSGRTRPRSCRRRQAHHAQDDQGRPGEGGRAAEHVAAVTGQGPADLRQDARLGGRAVRRGDGAPSRRPTPPSSTRSRRWVTTGSPRRARFLRRAVGPRGSRLVGAVPLGRGGRRQRLQAPPAGRGPTARHRGPVVDDQGGAGGGDRAGEPASHGGGEALGPPARTGRRTSGGPGSAWRAGQAEAEHGDDVPLDLVGAAAEGEDGLGPRAAAPAGPAAPRRASPPGGSPAWPTTSSSVR